MQEYTKVIVYGSKCQFGWVDRCFEDEFRILDKCIEDNYEEKGQTENYILYIKE